MSSNALHIFPPSHWEWMYKTRETNGFSLTIYTFSMILPVSLLLPSSFPAPFTCVIEILINSNFYPTFIPILCFQLFCAPPAVCTSQKWNGKSNGNDKAIDFYSVKGFPGRKKALTKIIFRQMLKGNWEVKEASEEDRSGLGKLKNRRNNEASRKLSRWRLSRIFREAFEKLSKKLKALKASIH